MNVSFKDNNLRTYDDLKGFKGKEFQNLRELILDGNPLRTKEVAKAGGTINLKSNVKSLFPSVKILDGEELLDEIKFGVEDDSKLKVPVRTGFSDSPETLALVQDFLLRYFYGLLIIIPGILNYLIPIVWDWRISMRINPVFPWRSQTTRPQHEKMPLERNYYLNSGYHSIDH